MQTFSYKQLDDFNYMITGYAGDETEVTIPSSYMGRAVTILFDDIFKNHTEIIRVIIPDTITDIGGFVFDGCVNLKTIDLPDSISEMWQYAFVRSGITEIRLPASLGRISPYVFQDCKNLKKVICNPGLKIIRGRAFKNCPALTEVYMSKETELAELAFEGAPDARVIYYQEEK